MSVKKNRISPDKPTLVVVGENMVDPKDVAAIKKIRSKSDLYIVVLKSQPNMEFPMWARGSGRADESLLILWSKIMNEVEIRKLPKRLIKIADAEKSGSIGIIEGNYDDVLEYLEKNSPDFKILNRDGTWINVLETLVDIKFLILYGIMKRKYGALTPILIEAMRENE